MLEKYQADTGTVWTLEINRVLINEGPDVCNCVR